MSQKHVICTHHVQHVKHPIVSQGVWCSAQWVWLFIFVNGIRWKLLHCDKSTLISLEELYCICPATQYGPERNPSYELSLLFTWKASVHISVCRQTFRKFHIKHSHGLGWLWFSYYVIFSLLLPWWLYKARDLPHICVPRRMHAVLGEVELNC